MKRICHYIDKMINKLFHYKKNADETALKSLAPTSEADNNDIYQKYLDGALNEKDNGKLKNKNIAISGGYGAGKSSILKTYFKDVNNVLFVSLGNYIEKASTPSYEETNEKLSSVTITMQGETKNKKEERKILKNTNTDDIIEISILQQILYSVRPKQIPLSRFNRIDKVNGEKKLVLKAVIISFYIYLFFLVLYAINNPIALLTLNDFYHNFKISATCFVEAITISLILYSSIFFLVYFIISKFNIKKISFDKIELSKNGIDESILNKYIDELINFFLFNNYSIVVFEDLDRFDNSLIIFSKLKEINSILNISIEKKTIQFIYAIGDSLFKDGEKRTKFFDIIIPIVPYTGARLSNSLFEELNKKYSLDIDSDTFNHISLYVDSARTVYDIINEYRVYYDYYHKNMNFDKINEEDKKQLFYLITYKVLYPTKFDDFLDSKNDFFTVINYLLTEDYTYSSLTKHKENIKKATGEIKKVEEQIDNFIQSLIDIQIEANNSYDKNNENYYNVYTYEDKLINLQTIIKTPSKYSQLFETKGIILKNNIINNNTNKNVYLNLFEDGKKKYNKYVELNTFKKHLEKKSFIKNNTNILNELEEENIINTQNLDIFEKEIIMFDIIKENYKNLLVNRKGDSISYKDESFILSIRSNNALKTTSLDNPIKVINKLSSKDFAYDAICNDEIFKNLNSSKNVEKFLEVFFNNFSEYKYNFITENVIKNNINNNIIKDYPQFIKYIWDYLDNNYNEEQTKFYVYIDILYSKKNDVNEAAKEYLLILHDMDKFLNDKIFSIKNQLKKLKLSFCYDCKYNPKYEKFLNVIYGENLFDYNIEIIIAIMKMKKLEVKKETILSDIYYNKEKVLNIYNKVFNNLYYSIEQFRNQIVSFKDPEKFIIEFLNNDIYEKNGKFFLLVNEKTQINKINLIPNYYLECCIGTNLIKITWKNVLYLFSTIEYQKKAINILSNNINILINQPNLNKKQLTKYILDNWAIIDKFVINKLLEKDFLQTNEWDDIMKVKIDNNISEKNYQRFLSNCFPLLKKKIYKNMTSEILKDILKESNKMGDKIQYVLKYKYLIDNNLKFNLAIDSYIYEIDLDKPNILFLTESLLLLPSIYIKFFNFHQKSFTNVLDLLQENDFGKKIINKEKVKISNNQENLQFCNILKNKAIIKEVHTTKNYITLKY